MRFPAALFLATIPTLAPALAQSLTYSTYVRDHYAPIAIAVDSSGNIYVAGNATIDPLTQQIAPMVMKLDPAGQRVIYTRILGGSSGDTAAAIAVDQGGDVYIAGSTVSPDFPVTSPGTPPTLMPTGPTDPRAFLLELDPQGAVLFSETIGAVSNTGHAVAITRSRNRL